MGDDRPNLGPQDVGLLPLTQVGSEPRRHDGPDLGVRAQVTLERRDPGWLARRENHEPPGFAGCPERLVCDSGDPHTAQRQPVAAIDLARVPGFHPRSLPGPTPQVSRPRSRQANTCCQSGHRDPFGGEQEDQPPGSEAEDTHAIDIREIHELGRDRAGLGIEPEQWVKPLESQFDDGPLPLFARRSVLEPALRSHIGRDADQTRDRPCRIAERLDHGREDTPGKPDIDEESLPAHRTLELGEEPSGARSQLVQTPSNEFLAGASHGRKAGATGERDRPGQVERPDDDRRAAHDRIEFVPRPLQCLLRDHPRGDIAGNPFDSDETAGSV